jgi:hypothetical protein
MFSHDLFSGRRALPMRPIAESYWVIPERLLAGEYPEVAFFGERACNRLDAFLASGFDSFFDLTGIEETGIYSAALHKQADHYGKQVEYHRFPITDFGLPTPQLMTEILNALDFSLADGRKIYLHCLGGIGRTGTTVGCFLVRHGYTGQQAVHKLADWWRDVPKSVRYPHSPETAQQKEFILDWREN